MTAEAWLNGAEANPQAFAPAGHVSIAAAGTEAADAGNAVVVQLLPAAQVVSLVASGAERPDAGAAAASAHALVMMVGRGTEAADGGAARLRAIGAPALNAAQQAEVLYDAPIIKLPEEILVFVFDFSQDLLPAESITGVDRIVASAVGSDDPNPDAIRLGPPQVTPSALFQYVEGGMNGVNYLMAATVDTTIGRRLKGEITVRVRQAVARPTRRM